MGFFKVYIFLIKFLKMYFTKNLKQAFIIPILFVNIVWQYQPAFFNTDLFFLSTSTYNIHKIYISTVVTVLKPFSVNEK